MFEIVVITALSSVAEKPISPPEVYPIYSANAIVVVKEAPRSELYPDKNVALFPDARVESLDKGLIKGNVFLPGIRHNRITIANPRNIPLED